MRKFIFFERLFRQLINAILIFYFYFEFSVEWFTSYSVIGFCIYLGTIFGAQGSSSYAQKRVLIFTLEDSRDLITYKFIGLVLAMLATPLIAFFYGILPSVVFLVSSFVGIFDFVEYIEQHKERDGKNYFILRFLGSFVFLISKLFSANLGMWNLLVLFIGIEVLSIGILNVFTLRYRRLMPAIFSLPFPNLRNGNAWKGSWKFFLISLSILVYMKFDMFILSSLPKSDEISTYFFSLRIVEYGFMLFTIYFSVLVLDLNSSFLKADGVHYFKRLKMIVLTVFSVYILAIFIYLFVYDYLPVKLQLLRTYLLILSLNFISLSFSLLYGNYLYNRESYSIMYQMSLTGLLSGTLISTVFYNIFGVIGLAYGSVIVQFIVGFGFAIFYDSNFLKKVLWSNIM